MVSFVGGFKGNQKETHHFGGKGPPKKDTLLCLCVCVSVCLCSSAIGGLFQVSLSHAMKREAVGVWLVTGHSYRCLASWLEVGGMVSMGYQLPLTHKQGVHRK